MVPPHIQGDNLGTVPPAMPSEEGDPQKLQAYTWEYQGHLLL